MTGQVLNQHDVVREAQRSADAEWARRRAAGALSAREQALENASLIRKALEKKDRDPRPQQR